jgi:hypothetical protein
MKLAKQVVDLVWYDQEMHCLGTTRSQSPDTVAINWEKARIEAIYPNAAFVLVRVTVDLTDVDHTVHHL